MIGHRVGVGTVIRSAELLLLADQVTHVELVEEPPAPRPVGPVGPAPRTDG